MDLRTERGFSLTELLVSISLLFGVLAMSWGALSAVYAGREASDRQAMFAQEIAAPLNYLDEVLEQNMTIENPTAYSASLITDTNQDNVRERHIVSASADGKLRDQVWLTNASGVNTTLSADYLWSTNNANRGRTIALFRYYTAATTTSTAQEITVMSDVPSKARLVKITIVVEYNGRPFQDSRQSFLRNR